jgi:hypothetical protein
MKRNCRSEFFDTLQDLCGYLEETGGQDQIVWKAEYLTRKGRWFHYYGINRAGRSSSIGHEFDPLTGNARDACPSALLFTLLNFDANRTILTYMGNNTVATDILLEVQEANGEMPEIIRLSIEARCAMPCGRRMTAITNVAFVGFARRKSRRRASERAPPKGGDISLKWYRDRRYISALPNAAAPTAIC